MNQYMNILLKKKKTDSEEHKDKKAFIKIKIICRISMKIMKSTTKNKSVILLSISIL